MNKPVKKEGSITKGIGYNAISDMDVGYNQACDDWEGFLPSEEDIEIILTEYGVTDSYDIAKAIAKRMGMK